MGKVEDKGEGGSWTKRRGTRKEGLTPGSEKGVWPGQAKWHTCRQLRFGPDYKDIDLVQRHCQQTSRRSWYKTTMRLSFKDPIQMATGEALREGPEWIRTPCFFFPPGFFLMQVGHIYLSPSAQIYGYTLLGGAREFPFFNEEFL